MQATFDQALGLIYESALDPERLRDALNAMIAVLDGDTCHLIEWNRQTAIPSLSIAIGLNEEETAPAYFSYYGNIDPRRRLASTMALGRYFPATSISTQALSIAMSSTKIISFVDWACTTCSAPVFRLKIAGR